MAGSNLDPETYLKSTRQEVTLEGMGEDYIFWDRTLYFACNIAKNIMEGDEIEIGTVYYKKVKGTAPSVARFLRRNKLLTES